MASVLQFRQTTQFSRLQAASASCGAAAGFSEFAGRTISKRGTTLRGRSISARAYHRVLKLARTIADLAGENEIDPTHLAEALQYRPKLGMM